MTDNGKTYKFCFWCFMIVLCIIGMNHDSLVYNRNERLFLASHLFVSLHTVEMLHSLVLNKRSLLSHEHISRCQSLSAQQAAIV